MPRPRPDIPGPGQESVWDYPRPPRIERVHAPVTIRLGGQLIVETRDVVRVLETSHPPVYYLPIADFATGALVDADVELSDDPVAAVWQLAAIAPLGEYDRYTLLRSTSMGDLLRQLIDLTIDAEELWSAERGI